MVSLSVTHSLLFGHVMMGVGGAGVDNNDNDDDVNSKQLCREIGRGDLT